MSVKEILQANGLLYPDTMFAPQGWVCPKCRRVYSPFTPMCLYCGDKGNVTVSTTSTGYVQKRGDEVTEPRYCDRNICTQNEYNGVSCDECEIAKNYNLEDDDSPCLDCGEE